MGDVYKCITDRGDNAGRGPRDPAIISSPHSDVTRQNVLPEKENLMLLFMGKWKREGRELAKRH